MTADAFAPEVRLAALARRFPAFVFDQYGVLHDGERPYPGVLDALARLRAGGACLAVLSNSSKRAAYTAERLRRLGFDPDLFDAVVTSGEVAWAQLAAEAPDGAGCYVVARDADRSYLDGTGIREVDDPARAARVLIAGSEAPVVSLAEYARRLAPAARRGVPALCINPDRQMVTPHGLFPGAGQIAEAYAAAGAPVRWLGKPYPEVFRSALARLGTPAAATLMVGDSLEHDIAGAAAAGMPSALVRTGIAAEPAGATQGPDGATPTFLLPNLAW